MPSPIAHLAMGYGIARAHNRLQTDKLARVSGVKFKLALLLSLFFSMAPDVDSVLGVLAGNFSQYHNNLTHSLFFGLLAAGLFSFVLRQWWPAPRLTIFVIALAAYEMHVVMDFFTIGRGVMLFWPVTDERFLGPVRLFYGFHWSDGLISIRHLWTFLTESVFAALVFLIVNVAWPRLFFTKRQQSSVDI